MKHYRILEKKDDTKYYIIQYTQNLFLGLFYWKNLTLTHYTKYEDSLNEVKKIILQTDYNTDTCGYHYIDAYKLFKYKEVKEVKEEVKVHSNKNKSVFIPKK